MTKSSFPLLLSFFLALFLNADSKAQIVYPDKATFDIDMNGYIIPNNMQKYISNYQSKNFSKTKISFGSDSEVGIKGIDEKIEALATKKSTSEPPPPSSKSSKYGGEETKTKKKK